jgi:hypothetical protein
MKMKLRGIFICMMLVIISLIPITSGISEKNIESTDDIDNIPIIDLRDPPILNFGKIPFVFVNIGDGTATDIKWEMNILEGSLFSPKNVNGTISQLEPDEGVVRRISLTGLGVATIEFNIAYKIENISGCDVEFKVKQEWIDLSIFFIHLFIPSMQPDKEWVRIENYTYLNVTDQQGVELEYGSLLQMHNVRVVEGRNTDEIKFLAACKFISGSATLDECWITKDIVTGGDAHWEVELLDDE